MILTDFFYNRNISRHMPDTDIRPENRMTSSKRRKWSIHTHVPSTCNVEDIRGEFGMVVLSLLDRSCPMSKARASLSLEVLSVAHSTTLCR